LQITGTKLIQMKKKIIITALGLMAILLQFNPCNAQTISITRIVSSPAQNLVIGDTLNLVITIQNSGSQLISNDSLTVYYGDSAGLNAVLLTEALTLGPRDTVQLPGVIKIEPQIFMNNFTNTILIWPVLGGINYNTGMELEVCVGNCLTTAGIADLKKSVNDYLMYPNPCSSIVNLQYAGSNNVIEYLSIYNSIGSLITVIKGNTKQIDVSQFPTGLYTIEIESNDSQRSILRFVKE
jgi:hypothetical protein